jgi:AraC-like DNA-binding protein
MSSRSGGPTGCTDHPETPPIPDLDAAATWQLVSSPPGPALRGIVAGYKGYIDGAPGRAARAEHPASRVPLVIDLGAGWRVATLASGYRPVRLHAFAAGIGDAPALVEPAGPVLGVQVDLSPIGARRLLGVPMQELANAAIALHDLMGAGADELAERLAPATDWPQRFATVEVALERAMAGAPPVSAEVEWAWRELRSSAGSMPIDRIVARLGWSRKRFIAHFRDTIGITPKKAARVLRFEGLIARLGSGKAPAPWAQLALECGYFDQSHLIRDVHRFTGGTPTRLLETFVQDGGRREAAE